MATVAVSTVTGGLAGWWAQSRTSSPSATVATTSPASSLTTGPAVSSTSLAPTSTTVPTNATLAGQGLSVAEVLAKVGPAVVNIEATVVAQVGPRQVSGTSAGTGIVLTADGKVLTNAHVVANATSMTVALPGESTAREATVLLRDSEADVAVLQITGASGLATAPLGIDAKVAVGDDVVAVGNALALEGGPTVTRGIVSALDRTIETSTTTLQHLIQTDAAISSGDSGGPLVNAAGQVIGLDTAGASSSSSVMAENMGFAIPIGQAMDVVEAAGILLT